MTTVAIREQYTDILSVFGNLEEAVNIALQRFVIEQITAKINELRRRDTEYRNSVLLGSIRVSRRAGVAGLTKSHRNDT